VADAESANIKIVMITGDYVKTAIAIARNIGILLLADDTSDLTRVDCIACDCVNLRPDGEYLPQDQLDRVVSYKRVFARAQPEDKLEIVKSLQRQNKVIAMPGDGVNDAPALNRADIGVAMGIQGTEVAKGASDMILTDDNFCSIIQAVEKGRVIYAGIQKFVAFIMSVHIGEVLQIFFCIIFNVPVMRTPLQILFLILVTDLPPSIALGMEPGQVGILKERPRPKSQPLVLPWMWVGIWVAGSILTGTAVAVYIVALLYFVGTVDLTEIANMINIQCGGTEDQFVACEGSETSIQLRNARTCAFICVVWCENLRAYVARSFYLPIWVGMFSNINMQKAVGAAQVALYIVILAPGLSTKIMELDGQGLPWQGWVLGIGGSFACLLLCEVYKPLVRRQSEKFNYKLYCQQKAEEDARMEKYEEPADKM
jgi:magnesium-transporting ATPase (P-type)